MGHLTIVAALALVVPICEAQQPAAQLKSVSTSALRFLGLGTAGGPVTPTAGPSPNAPQTLPGVTVVLNVPYSFENPGPDLKRAVIKCVLLAYPNSAHLTEQQIVIPLDGQSISGTAPVTFAPRNNRDFAIARAYTCFIEVANKQSITYALGSKGPPWSRSQPGSVLLVRGTIEGAGPGAQ